MNAQQILRQIGLLVVLLMLTVGILRLAEGKAFQTVSTFTLFLEWNNTAFGGITSEMALKRTNLKKSAGIA